MARDMLQEDVPTFDKRVGDMVLAGSNNSFLVLGRDRAASGPATVQHGRGDQKQAGSAHLIAGLQDGEGNPDLDLDSSYLYLSMKSEPDKNLGTKMEGDAGEVSTAILKSDTLRMLARKDVKIVFDGDDSYIHLSRGSCTIKIGGVGFVKVEKDLITCDSGKGFVTMGGGKIVVHGEIIELGEGANSEPLVLGNSFMTFFNSHFHVTNVGPTGPASLTSPMTPLLLSKRAFLLS